MAEEIPGWAVPLHRSLTEPILVGGIPRGIAVALGTLAAAIGLGLQLWLAGVAIYVVGHGAALGGITALKQSRDCFAVTAHERRNFRADAPQMLAIDFYQPPTCPILELAARQQELLLTAVRTTQVGTTTVRISVIKSVHEGR